MLTAALFTRTWTGPTSARTASVTRLISARSATSMRYPTARPPNSSASAAATSAVRRSCLSVTTTVAPAAASRRAVVWPMPPPAAAVTSVILPRSSSDGGGGNAGLRSDGMRRRLYATIVGDDCPSCAGTFLTGGPPAATLAVSRAIGGDVADLEGKTVIIAGVGSGLGRETAAAALREGGNVVMGARTASMLESVAKEIDPTGERVAHAVTD